MANLKDLIVNGVTRFIGKVYAPTPAIGSKDSQVATTSFVVNATVASAATATKATQDGSGNVITDTYATTAFVSNATSAKMDLAPQITTLTAGTSVALVDNSINRITIDTATTFVLPTITDNTKLHQILVQITLSYVVAINVGTTMYFNAEAPDLSSTGNYNLIYEYNGTDWVCGSLTKGTV